MIRITAMMWGYFYTTINNPASAVYALLTSNTLPVLFMMNKLL